MPSSHKAGQANSGTLNLGLLALLIVLVVLNVAVQTRYHPRHDRFARAHASAIRDHQHDLTHVIRRSEEWVKEAIEGLDASGVAESFPHGGRSETFTAHAANPAVGIVPSTAAGASPLLQLQSRRDALQHSLTRSKHLQHVVEVREKQMKAVRTRLEAAERTDSAHTHGGLEGLKPGGVVWLTFTNGADKYAAFMLNWVAHVRDLELAHVVVALDTAAARICASHDVPYILNDKQTESHDFRGSFDHFRAMGAQKPRMVQRLMEEHGAAAVVISDTDVVWLRDPSPFMAAHPTADVLVSTDCLHAQLEIDSRPDDTGGHGVNRCGHLVGDSSGWAFNTGTIIFRATAASKAFLTAWHDYLNSEEEANRHQGSWKVTDQLAFNLLMAQELYPARSAHPGAPDWRPLLAANRSIELMPLPVPLFLNGHVAFQQHLHRAHDGNPYALHTTFQRQHTWGKMARLREYGLWRMDPPAYYADPDFLAYDNGVMDFVAGLPADWPQLRVHFAAAAYQMAALRDALAIGHELNRTVVLPHYYCWCDQDWYVSVLDNCVMAGSEFSPPFECTADWFFNIYHMEHLLEYRFQAALEAPDMPEHVRRSSLTVTVLPRGVTETRDMVEMHRLGMGSHIRMGASGEAIAEQLAPLRATRILRLAGLQPGTFGGWSRAASAAKTAWVDHVTQAVMGTFESRWCCSGENHNKEHRPQMIDSPDTFGWQYSAPTPLAAGAAGGQQHAEEWRLPEMPRPEFCDHLNDTRFVEHPNHPCTFLKVVDVPHAV